jgi:thioredoxin reductase (NADPH)
VTGIESEQLDDPVALPPLSDAQRARLQAYGTPQAVEAGDVLYGPGDATYDLVVLEARSCANGPATVVGGGNGAGQAALFLASCGCDVTVAIRRPEIESGMSRYLVDRLLANPKITVRGGTEVKHLDGDDVLESISLTGPDGELREQACRGLFCFIGAEPATS